MRCPDCKMSLVPVERATGVRVHGCPRCSGIWLPFDEHLRWVETGMAEVGSPSGVPGLRTEELPAARTVAEQGGADSALIEAPRTRPRLCPRCGRIMPRLRVSLDLPFTLDRCGLSNGLWFERGELEAIELAGMLPRLYHHLNDTAQHRLAAEAKRRELERQCREAVGEEAFERVRVFKEWLNAHPERMRLWAYLDDGEM